MYVHVESFSIFSGDLEKEGDLEDRIEEILSRDEDQVSKLIELVTEYQAKAWDKGFDRGSMAYSGVKRIYVAPGPTKGNRNPYRAQLEHHNGRR